MVATECNPFQGGTGLKIGGVSAKKTSYPLTRNVPIVVNWAPSRVAVRHCDTESTVPRIGVELPIPQRWRGR